MVVSQLSSLRPSVERQGERMIWHSIIVTDGLSYLAVALGSICSTLK